MKEDGGESRSVTPKAGTVNSGAQPWRGQAVDRAAPPAKLSGALKDAKKLSETQQSRMALTEKRQIRANRAL